MWFFMAFRGLDLSSKVDGFYYHDFFENDVTTLAQFDFNILSYTRTVQAKTGFGWGFGLLSAVCKTICPRFEFFQVVFTALLFVLLAMVMRELHLSDQEKCLFLFFYMTQQMLWYFCNLLRQAPANLIVWYVMLHEFKDHKWIKRILLIGVAMFAPHVCGTGTGHDRGVGVDTEKRNAEVCTGGFAAGCAADAVF